MISDAVSTYINTWLNVSRATKGSSDNTIKAYQRDVQDYCAFIAVHTGEAGSDRFARGQHYRYPRVDGQ